MAHEPFFERTVTFDCSAEEMDQPIIVQVLKLGETAKVEIPQDSPLNEFPEALQFYALGSFFGQLAETFNQQAALSGLEDDN